MSSVDLYSIAGEAFLRVHATTGNAGAAMRYAMRVLKGIREEDGVSEARKRATAKVPPWAVVLRDGMAEASGVRLRDLLTSSVRHGAISRVREEIAWRLRNPEEDVRLSYPVIAACLGMDSASVQVAVRRFEKRLAQDELLRARMEKERAA